MGRERGSSAAPSGPRRAAPAACAAAARRWPARCRPPARHRQSRRASAHSAPSRCRCRAGRSAPFPRRWPSLRPGFRYPACRSATACGRIDQIAAPWSGNSAAHARAAMSISATRSGVGWARMSPIFSPASSTISRRSAAGEFDIDLLADDAPAQGIEAGGQQRHAQAPARSATKAAWRVSNWVTSLVRARIFSAGGMQRRHGCRGPASVSAWTFTQAWPGSMLISSTAGPSSVCSAFQMRLPSLLSLTPCGSRA